MAVRRILNERIARLRLEEISQQRGYETAAKMIHDLYVFKEMPITKIAQELFTSTLRVRFILDEIGVKVRSRGHQFGHEIKIQITDDLIAQVSRDGIAAVAERWGVAYVTLFKRLKQWQKEQVRKQLE